MIAAVVPTVGASPLLVEALEALRGEIADGERVRVILVSQGPARNPEAESLCDRVLTAERNLGFAGATNLGLKAARELSARWVATVNDDLRVEPGWAQALVEALESEPRAAAVQGVQLRLDDPSVVDGGGLGWNRLWQAVQLGRDGAAPGPGAAVCEIFGVSATAALYRAEALEAVRSGLGGAGEDTGGEAEGPFDTRLGSYYEDVELACRLRAAGGMALQVPRARALHAGSVTGRSLSLQRWRWIYGNRLLVLARLLGSRFPRELPRILMPDVRDLLRAGVTGRGRRAAGILGGWGRAGLHLRGFVRRGAPLVPLVELKRFRVSSRHP